MTRRETAAVLAGMTAVTLVMTYPVVRTSATALPNDPGDPLLNTWILAWDADRIRHGMRAFWDLPAFFPYPHTLVYTEHLLGIALLVAPLNWATRNPILAYNAAFLLSFIVAGAGMYGLVRSLTGRRDAAWLAGLIYAFCPYRMGMISHLQILWSGWLPVALWALHRYFRTRSRTSVAAFAAAFLMQALSNGYFLYFSLVPILVVAIVEASSRRLPIRKLAGDALLASAIIAVALAPIILAYYQERDAQALVRSYREIRSYRADVASYWHAPDAVYLWRWLPGMATPEGDLFPGAVALVLASFCWPRRPRASHATPRARIMRWDPISTYATIGLLGFLLSLGPEPAAWGHPLFSHAPYEWLMRFVPGFDGLRVPARFAVLVFLSLAVLAGFGAGRVIDAAMPRARGLAIAALSMAILAEGYAAPLPVVTVPPMSAGDREAYQWLRDRPPGAAIEFPIQRPLSHSPLVYPTRDPAGYLNTLYQYRTLLHRHPIVNGHSGYEPLVNVQLRRLIEDHQLGDALEMLRSVGVAYVIVHPPGSSTQPLPAVTSSDVAVQQEHIAEQVGFGETTAFRLRPWLAQALTDDTAGLRLVPVNSMRAITSEATDRLTLAFDGNRRSGWSSAGPQAGREWIEIQFDHPRRIARVQVDLGADFSDYPRELVVEGARPESAVVELFHGSVIPFLARGLVRNPSAAPIAIPLPPTTVSSLWLRQTGRSQTWHWSIHELTIYEQP